MPLVGPFATQGEALAACGKSGSTSKSGSSSRSTSSRSTSTSGSPALGGVVSCCGRALNATVFATAAAWTGTLVMTWDGTYWKGSKALPCGETLWLRMGTACALEFSCNGSGWNACTNLGGVTTCNPLFSSTGWTANMDNFGAGCVVGLCGTITGITIGE